MKLGGRSICTPKGRGTLVEFARSQLTECQVIKWFNFAETSEEEGMVLDLFGHEYILCGPIVQLSCKTLKSTAQY